MSENTLHPEDLRHLFRYDDGDLVWLKRADLPRSWNTKHAGKIAGTSDPLGYRIILIHRKPYKAHRVIWAIINGAWPHGHIDHIDGNPSNNRIENLRVVTSRENGRNMRRRRDNTSGATGVYFRSHIQKWVARIWANDRDNHLGVFETQKDAIAARKNAERAHGFHYNHGAER